MFKALRFFMRYGWKYDKLYVVEKALLQLVQSLTPLAAAVLPKLVIDELMGARRPERLALWVALLAGCVLLTNAASAFLSKDSFSHRLRVDAAFGLELHAMQARADFAALADPEYLDLRKKAEKFITCDYHGFGYLLDCALDIAGQCGILAGVAAAVFMLNGWLLPAYAGMSLLGGLAEARARRRAMALYDRVVAATRGWNYYAGLFGDARYGKEIRLNGIAGWLLGREKAYCAEAVDDMKRQNDFYIRADAAGAACHFVQQALTYGWLCAGVLRGTVGIGDFAMYTAAMTAFAAALRRVMESALELRAYDRYFEDVDRYLRLPSKLREGPGREPPAGPPRIEFLDVGFRYPGQETWALRHVNLVIEPGETLAIVGENGAGKTTLVKLLVRLVDPAEGRILLNGADIRTLDLDAYMGLFATVFQDFKLFSFSLKDNVTLGAERTDAEIEALLAKVGLGARVGRLAGGIHTHVNREFDEHGFEPSGGEAQKIALARALCRDAPFVILDEPTAALDPRAERALYARLAELAEGRSALLISHRLSSARFCDRIAVFSGGRLAEYGDHAALCAADGLYAELYRMQAQLYN